MILRYERDDNMRLNDWFKNNVPHDDMLWKTAMKEQVFFVRDILWQAMPMEDGNETIEFKNNIEVVSVHTSKSISLPVYKLKWRHITFYARNNFHNWMLSCIIPFSQHSIDFEQLGYRTHQKVGTPEGFAPEWVFDCYNANGNQFTIEMYSDYDLYSFIKVLTWTLKDHRG